MTINLLNKINKLQKNNQQIECSELSLKDTQCFWNRDQGVVEKTLTNQGSVVRVVNKQNEVGNGYSIGSNNSLEQAYHFANLSAQKVKSSNFLLTQKSLEIPQHENKELPNLKVIIKDILNRVEYLYPISISLIWHYEKRKYINNFNVEGNSEYGYFTCAVNTSSYKTIKTYIGTNLEFFLTEISTIANNYSDNCFSKLYDKTPFTGMALFEPLPFAIILSYIGSWFCLQEGTKCMLKNKINKKVAPDFVSLYDDPNYNHPYPISLFDSEGIRSTKVNLIKDGVLKSILTDRISAEEWGFSVHGNKQLINITTPPRVAPNILVLSQGKNSKDNIIRDIRKGFLIKEIQQFSSGFDYHSGNFNFLVEGNPIESGEILNIPVKTIIRGNILTLLENIVNIGNDSREITFFGRVVCPSVAVDGISIGGYQ